MANEQKIPPTEAPEPNELSDADLEQVNGGAIDPYLYFDPPPPPKKKP